jgi:glycosyltransferase involved in cell wall biosynthesis
MPVRGRRELALKAVACFLDQTYGPKELLILQDEDELTFDIPDWCLKSNILISTSEKKTIGAKRNELAMRARGEFIAHFDSDDWSDPDRLNIQVKAMQESGLAVSGFKTMIFWDEEYKKATKYLGHSEYVLGTSLVYRRYWWELHPFPQPPSNVGEDTRFVSQAAKNQQLLELTHDRLMVARIHSDNTSQFKRTRSFVPIDKSVVPQAFFA